MFGTELKICGLSRLEDIIAVNRHGADYAGFVFFQKSKRYVDPYKASELINLLRADIVPVGVFMDEPLVLLSPLKYLDAFLRKQLTLCVSNSGHSVLNH